jgi:5-methylcytosine-specific restriction endonuclease McrA
VLRDRVVNDEPICWLQFPGVCTRVSTTADHVIPKSVRPDLVMVRSNLRGACLPCNKARNTTPIEALRLTDEARPALGIFD